MKRGGRFLIGWFGLLALALSCARSEDDTGNKAAGGTGGAAGAEGGGAAGAAGSDGGGAGGTGGVDAGGAAGSGGAGATDAMGGTAGTGGCATTADCPTPPNECSIVVCKAGQCLTSYAASGALATQQTVGDCKLKICDGNGGFTEGVNDADLPNDGKPCTDDTCQNGVPKNTPKPVGTSCSGGLSCDANGDCVGCISGSLCPGTDTECQTRTCASGTCGFSYAPAGTKVTAQTAADCKVDQCDGNGNVITVNAATDLPVDGKACTDDLCTNGVPSNPQKAPGTPCGGGLACDSTGACAGCTSPTSCPGTDTECRTRTCSAGSCGFSYKSYGTAVSAQTPGDCQENICDGTGNVTSLASSTDVLVDGKQCTSDICTAGVPSNPPLSSGASCSESGGKVCNGSGTCVECVSNSDCPSGSNCQSNKCTTVTCSSGTLDCDGSGSNGCECSGPYCCGAACLPAHINGLGQTFESCLPLGTPGTASTYSLQLATEARNAWPQTGTDSPCNCVGPGGGACVLRQTSKSCAVWVYEKSMAGYVHLNTADNKCSCPTTADPYWQ